LQQAHVDRAYVNSPVMEEIVERGGSVFAKPWALRPGADRDCSPRQTSASTCEPKSSRAPRARSSPSNQGVTPCTSIPRCAAPVLCAPAALRAASGMGRSVSIAADESAAKEIPKAPDHPIGASHAPCARRRRAFSRAHRRAQRSYGSVPRRPKKSLRSPPGKRAPESGSASSIAQGGRIDV